LGLGGNKMNSMEQFEGFKMKDMNELTNDYRKIIIEEEINKEVEDYLI
jgi:hypothetical protein